ncbi:MAG: hypothetical protein EOP93_03955 [Lysobacteraceae bacterium]|nr:MAG: hypothetical protein EOP93_03955 [Xanthomonadaceae bacterium]
MLKSKKLPLALALAACMAAPVAFAQSSTGANVEPQANPQSATPAVPAVPADTTTDSQAAAPATPAIPATPAKKSWSELDANGNGSLSATEAAPMESLSKVFVKADVDANGELTQDEYKSWLAVNGKAKGKAKAGG